MGQCFQLWYIGRGQCIRGSRGLGFDKHLGGGVGLVPTSALVPNISSAWEFGESKCGSARSLLHQVASWAAEHSALSHCCGLLTAGDILAFQAY